MRVSRLSADSRRWWRLGLVVVAALGLALACNRREPGSTADRAIRVAVLRADARAREHGEGVPRISARAIELYCEAAQLGDAEAQFSLGWMYANGRGMARDNRMASLFFAMAAEQGHEYAQKMLAFVGPAAADLPECMRDPPPPMVAEAVDAETRGRFRRVDAGAEEGGRARAQARARIPDQPARSRSPSFAPSRTSIRTRARRRMRRG